MGHRECRRVPMDFDWPVNAVWDGYLSPKWRPCPSGDCVNGSTGTAAWLGVLTHLILMLGEDRQGKPLHPWLQALPLAPSIMPGSDAAELTGGLAGRPPGPMGHDASDRWSATNAIIKAAGLPEGWGTCSVCHGSAIHPDDFEASEVWEPSELPTGDGWQLWETTSEGSPQSPVFATAEELAEWCGPNATWFASEQWPAEQWLRSFLEGTTDVDSLLVIKGRP